MKLHITSLLYAFPYQNMEFHITKILKEIIAAVSWGFIVFDELVWV